MAQQTKIDFSNAIAPNRPPKSSEPTEAGPAAKRSKNSQIAAQITRMPPPPEYSVCSPDTPTLCGQELRRYVQTIASTRTQPIPFEEYLGKRLSAEHLEWYRVLLAVRIDTDEKFPIDLDDLWPMLEYSEKSIATRRLKKYRLDIDYILLDFKVKQTSGSGGHNQSIFKFNLDRARHFCATAGTPIGERIADFFLKVHSVTEEFMLIDSEIRGKMGRLGSVHDTLVNEYRNVDAVYLGFIQHLDSSSDLYSIGHSQDISERLKVHRKKYGNFYLVHATKAPYKGRAEQAIFHHPLIAPMRDSSIVEGDTEIFRVPRNPGALLSIKNTMDTVCREVCVAQGGFTHVNERQLPKTPEEMQHEKEMLILKQKHEITMLRLKQHGSRKAGPDTHAVFEAQMQRLARTSDPEDKWLPSLCAEHAGDMTDREIKLDGIIAEKTGIDPSIITENELRARRLNHIYHYRYDGDDIYLSASGIVLWMGNETITALRNDEYAEEFAYSDARTDIFSQWWDECTEPSSRTHVSTKALHASYNAFRNVQNDTESMKAFNKKLRESGIEVARSIRMNSVLTDGSGVYTGVKNRCLKTDHPSFQNIDWVYVESKTNTEHE